MSDIIVINIPEDWAGSYPSRFIDNGIITPAIQLATIFTIIATKMVKDK